MKRSYSLEEKLCAIGFVFQGESVSSVSRRLHFGHHTLCDWLERYKVRGIEGLKACGKKRECFSYEEKCRIVCEYQISNLTLYQFSVKHNISNSTLSAWIRLVESKECKALDSYKSSHSQTGTPMVKKLPKEEYEKENERLRKENERLRLENLLLKKVRALVEEREAQNRAIGRKPSRN